MKLALLRTGLKFTAALVMLVATMSVPWPSQAQQGTPPSASQQAAGSQSAAEALPPGASSAATTPSEVGTAADNSARSLKTVPTSLHELSPWSMFLSADIIVKAVMVGLALASVATW